MYWLISSFIKTGFSPGESNSSTLPKRVVVSSASKLRLCGAIFFASTKWRYYGTWNSCTVRPRALVDEQNSQGEVGPWKIGKSPLPPKRCRMVLL